MGNMIKDSKVKDHMKVYEDTYHKEKLPTHNADIQRLLARNINIESGQDAKLTGRDPTAIASERRSAQNRRTASSLEKRSKQGSQASGRASLAQLEPD